MKKALFLIPIFFITACLYYCQNSHEPTTPNLTTPTPHYLSFGNNPCQGHPGELGKVLSYRTILQDYTQNGDTLVLKLHFVANCCPGFVDSAAVSPGNIVISLADTLGFCDCVCDYVDEFKFLYHKQGDLRIIFQWWSIPNNLFTTDLDTTIQINK